MIGNGRGGGLCFFFCRWAMSPGSQSPDVRGRSAGDDSGLGQTDYQYLGWVSDPAPFSLPREMSRLLWVSTRPLPSSSSPPPAVTGRESWYGREWTPAAGTSRAEEGGTVGRWCRAHVLLTTSSTVLSLLYSRLEGWVAQDRRRLVIPQASPDRGAIIIIFITPSLPPPRPLAREEREGLKTAPQRSIFSRLVLYEYTVELQPFRGLPLSFLAAVYSEAGERASLRSHAAQDAQPIWADAAVRSGLWREESANSRVSPCRIQ